MTFRVIRFGQDDVAMAAAREIRTVVFCQEQNVSAEEEWDGLDGTCDHFLIFEGDTAIGTARLRAYKNFAKIERVAVLKSHRGRQAGKILMEAVLNRARETGFAQALLNAQVAVERFYTDLGFTSEGAHFIEAEIEHVRMTRAL